MEVYAVHVVKPEAIGAVEVMYGSEPEARKYAAERSGDDRVVSASVTRFTIGQLGTRRPVTWFIRGAEQPVCFDRPMFPKG